MEIKSIIRTNGFIFFNISIIIFVLSFVGCANKSQKDLLIKYVMEKETAVYGTTTNLAKDYKIVDSLSKEWLNSNIFIIESPGSSPIIKYLLAINNDNEIIDINNALSNGNLETALNAIFIPSKCIAEMDLIDFNELFNFFYLSRFDSVASILVMNDLPDSLNTYYSPPIFTRDQNTLTVASTYMVKLNLRSQINLMRDSMIVTNKEIKLYQDNLLRKTMIVY